MLFFSRSSRQKINQPRELIRTSKRSYSSQEHIHASGYQEPNLLNDILQLSYPKVNQETYLIGVQHFLPSTVNLFSYLIQLGFNPANMLFSGKPYSTDPAAFAAIQNLGVHVRADQSLSLANYADATAEKIKAMWKQCVQDLKNRTIKSIIILDEGGRCIEHIPRALINEYPIIGIEQTRGGLYSKELSFRPFPVIEVASSAAKKYIEAPIIASSIIRKLDRILNFSEPLQFGIIGNGAIGTAIANYLVAKGYKIFIYDTNQKNVPNCAKFSDSGITHLPSIEHVIRNSDCILGCTGKDISETMNVFELIGDKIFISCSSEDKEFHSILNAIKKEFSRVIINPLENIWLRTDSNDKILLASGGFPINFDRTPESDPKEMILMRGLLMGACVQASLLHKKESNSLVTDGFNRIMLDPYIQQYVVERWSDYYSEHHNQFVARFEDLNWIKSNSNGVYREDLNLNLSFTQNNFLMKEDDSLSSASNANTSLPKLTH